MWWWIPNDVRYRSSIRYILPTILLSTFFCKMAFVHLCLDITNIRTLTKTNGYSKADWLCNKHCKCIYFVISNCWLTKQACQFSNQWVYWTRVAEMLKYNLLHFWISMNVLWYQMQKIKEHNVASMCTMCNTWGVKLFFYFLHT